LAALRQIEIRVMPRQKKEVKYQEVKLTNEAASCLYACADSITDTGLQEALRHLAAHHKKPAS
jgi:hypothetical protein